MTGSERGQSEALPIACSLGPAERARRAQEIRGGLLASATGVERLPDGVRFSFRETRDLFVRLAPMIDAERGCCPFLRFIVTAEPGLREVVLEITGPDGTAQFLEDSDSGRNAMNAENDLLLRLIDQAYDHRSWHGTNLRGSVRGMSAEFAARRPAPERHNIWEIVVHAAYWKYAVLRRLTGAKRGSFPLKGSNWFERPASGLAPADKAWRADLVLLADMHRALRDVVAQVPPRALHRNAVGSPFTNADLITGIAAHDLYHAGQIQLLKRLLDPNPGPRTPEPQNPEPRTQNPT